MKKKNYKIRINKGYVFLKLLFFMTATVAIISWIYIVYYTMEHNFRLPFEITLLFLIALFLNMETLIRSRRQVPETWLRYIPNPSYAIFLKSIQRQDRTIEYLFSPYDDIVRDKLLNKMFDEIESKYKEQYYSGNDFEKNQILLSVKDSVYDDVLEKM